MEKDKHSEIDRQTVERYSKRYLVHGESPLTVGWGSSEQQQYRFARALECADFAARTVLDVGCGFGDFFAFLRTRRVPIGKYVGIDINPEFIAVATKKYASAEFACASLIDAEEGRFASDIVVMLGLLNFKQEVLENPRYSRDMVTKGYSLCRETLIADFLSVRITDDYPKEDFVYYYDPRKVLELGLELSPNVVLKHDYRPIPQREMMLVVRRRPCA